MSKSYNLDTADKYENLDEITIKISNASDVTIRDKELLFYRLNQLTKKAHRFIFTEILQKLDKRIYTITENSTLFDLNDLPNEVFWKLFYHSQLSIKNMQRKKEIIEFTRELEKNNEHLQNNMNQELSKHIRKEEHQQKVDISQLSEYEKLRNEALSRCTYSTYYNKNHNELDLSLPDDKRLDRTIYSDDYKHRWKSNNDNSSGEKDTTTTTTFQQNDTNDYDDEIDDDDLMINESIDQIGGENVTQEEEEAELTHFKNQLLKSATKKKIRLKVSIMNYEEEDDDIF